MSSNVSPLAGAVVGGRLIIEGSEDLLESMLERGIPEAEADSAEADVGKHGVCLDGTGQDGTHQGPRRRGQTPQPQWTIRQPREHLRELVRLNRIVVDEEIPAARFAVLGEMHECSGTVVDVNGRHPRPGDPELHHTAARHDRIDDAFAKPRAVAVDTSGERGDDWQSGRDVPVEAIERGSELASAAGGAGRFVLGDGTLASRAVPTRVCHVHDSPRCAAGNDIQQVRIHQHAVPCDGINALPGQAP